MKRIAHISDLHFGAERPNVVAALLDDLRRQRPALVAVSGDLTQRARRSEFERAREFLESIPFPKVVVPGNHDIPFYDVARRVFRPLHRYRKHITPDLFPRYEDEELFALGLNTARSAALKEGRVSLLQIERMKREFGRAKAGLRVLVTHHPFLGREEDPKPRLVGRADLALRALEEAGADLLLAGHAHRGLTGDVRRHHRQVRRSIIVALCGTSTSRRERGEPNSYNSILWDGDTLDFETRAWNGSRFAPAFVSTYRRQGHEWRPTMPA